MRVLIAGGGTGGHLYPGLAVADEVVQRDTTSTVGFVGTALGIEARVVPETGYGLDLIDVVRLKGGGVLGWARGLLQLPRALLQSLAVLRRFRPDVVVGVGGYASGPVEILYDTLNTQRIKLFLERDAKLWMMNNQTQWRIFIYRLI